MNSDTRQVLHSIRISLRTIIIIIIIIIKRKQKRRRERKSIASRRGNEKERVKGKEEKVRVAE